MKKADILATFSADPDRYYRVRLFEEQGFVRRSCAKCRRYFWTLDAERCLCPDDAPDTYSFIADPPTGRRFDYIQSWRQVEDFFTRNGHASVPRYPVVCRWRDDLYFTIASIVDFQRLMGSKVVFEFPANPLVVPQTCLRFKDLENVGVTGRHFSSFCMIGQHSIPNSGGYWKDECIDLDFRLLTEQFGIKREEIVFVEDVWAGGGSFGSSLEYFVRGLELGNAVFTEFQGELGRHTALDQRIIDMGAGLERFAWITMGTPTAYDCCFGGITNLLLERAGIDPGMPALPSYFTEIAKSLDRYDLNEARRRAAGLAGISDTQMQRLIAPLEGIYLIADHLRTLAFAITDGALPSNVGGGYNLRMMLRRVAGTIDRLDLKLDVNELVDMHVNYLEGMYPELGAGRDDVKQILGIELARYAESRSHMEKKAARIRDRGTPTVDELITLYESDGMTPEYLREVNAISEVPPEFYSRLSELHQSGRTRNVEHPLPDGLPATDALYYGADPMEFEARVICVAGDSVVLDRTSFYARGGGQEPDHGTIAGFSVVDVEKHADIIVHKLQGGTPEVGRTVSCMVDAGRRSGITKHHTSTHILNASCRIVLGSWVWQHSAFKEHDHARLDITHHSGLTDQQLDQIEDVANAMIRDDLPVGIQLLDRGTAEQKYGFRIYQGGVVPVKSVRIVSIADRDVEACGGTHVRRTSEIGLIRITRAKRIQDGVVRLEFVSGEAALDHDREQQGAAEIRKKLDADREKLLRAREEKKQKTREQLPLLLEKVLSGISGTVDGMTVQNGICFNDDKQYAEEFHINFGRQLTAKAPNSAYCGMFDAGPTVRLVVYCGAESGRRADHIVRQVSGILGGSGGGSAKFAQGGGKDTSKKGEAASKARSMMFG